MQIHPILGTQLRINLSKRVVLLAGLATLAVVAIGPLSRAGSDNVCKSATTPVVDHAAAALDQKIIDEAKSHSEIMANLGYLSDEIGPRLTGSANLKRANEWTAERMKSYGLTNVHLEPWTIPMGWERGNVFARLLEPDNGRSLLMASMGWAPGTKGRISADVAVIKAKNSKDLQAYHGKLRDKIVLQGEPRHIDPVPSSDSMTSFFGGSRQKPKNDGHSPSNSPHGQISREMIQTYMARMAFRREMSAFLHNEGVAALLIDSEKPQGLLNMSGSWATIGGGDRASSSEPVPTLFVSHDHYAMLYRLATRPGPARTRMELEVSNKLIPGPIAVYNTVGEIRGKEKADECVILGAHLDSWDLGTGTTDNGTGSAIVLEAARVLSKCGVAPKRTIRFVLFSGEEEGLFGSREYVKKHKDEMPRISLCLVHDMGTGKVTGIYLQNREAIKPIFERELTSLKALGVNDLNLRPMPGSDHQSFDSAGVPGFAMEQDMSEYMWTHHSQSDTLDKAHEENLVQGTQAMAVAAMRVANLPGLLPHGKPAHDPFDFAAIHGGGRGQGASKPGK
jgi:carboxypeptidase Q